MTRAHDPYFFPARIEGGTATLDAADSAHLVKVRRARPGDGIHVSDGMGTVWVSTIASIGDLVVVELGERDHIEPTSPRISVLQAVAKADKNEQIVQKLVEIGVDEIVMFMAERSIPRWDAAKAAKVAERLAGVAREAAKQSRRAWLPTVLGPVPFDGSLSLLPERSFIAQPGAPTMAVIDPPPGSVGLVVGPEGGLTHAEVAAFLDKGAVEVGLGGGILRTETAGLVFAVVARRAYGLV